MTKAEQKKLDKLWKTIGKENARCEVCESMPEMRVNYSQLHPHHVEGRKSKSLRWDLHNRCWLCPFHHTLGTWSAHNSPKRFMAWFKYHRAEDYEYIGNHCEDIAKYQDFEELKAKLEVL